MNNSFRSIALVIRLDASEIVKVVDHSTEGLLHSFIATVRPRMDLMQRCPIAEVEAGHRIERELALLRLHQVIKHCFTQ